MLCLHWIHVRLQAHVLEQEVSAIVFGGAPPQLGANNGGGGGPGGGGGGGQAFGACRDCGAQLQLALNAEGPPSILCSAFPMHRLRIDLPRCTQAVSVSGGLAGMSCASVQPSTPALTTAALGWAAAGLRFMACNLRQRCVSMPWAAGACHLPHLPAPAMRTPVQTSSAPRAPTGPSSSCPSASAPACCPPASRPS